MPMDGAEAAYIISMPLDEQQMSAREKKNYNKTAPCDLSLNSYGTRYFFLSALMLI